MATFKYRLEDGEIIIDIIADDDVGGYVEDTLRIPINQIIVDCLVKHKLLQRTRL